MTDSEIISGIASGNKRVFDRLYLEHRRQFVAFLRRSQGVKAAEALDIYQDACAALHNNIVTGRLRPDSLQGATLKTYLFEVGKKILFNRRRKKQSDILFDTDAAFAAEESLCDEDETQHERLALVRRCVREMKPPCDKLLRLKLWYEMSSKEIAAEMNYSNEDSAKTQVHKCREKLKNYVKSQLKCQ